MATMDYENENGRYDAEEPRYERDRERSASPRPSKRDDGFRGGRDRSASPNGRMESRGPPPGASNGGDEREDSSRNPGSNLFVTGIHPRLSEAEVSRMFEKYGEVEGCSIMKDPHTQESRGFGFVKMVTAEQADAAKDALSGEVVEGRTLSIEKARRARPRTPTPGKYFGPPKREDERGSRRGDDRRGGSGYHGGYRDDYYRTSSSRYDGGRDRRHYGGAGRRDDYGRSNDRGSDRHGRDGGRDGRDSYDDRSGRDDRRGGDYRDSGRSGYEGASRDTREPYGGRVLDDRADDRYARR